MEAKLIRRMQQGQSGEAQLRSVIADTFSILERERLEEFLSPILNDGAHHHDHIRWRSLNQEIQAAARLQAELKADEQSSDAFMHYAELYDAIVCQPCLEGFIAPYLKAQIQNLSLDLVQERILSVGCGTGLVEQHLISDFGANPEQLYGMDLSAAMIEVAKTRIKADVGNVLELDPALGTWSMIFSGLNVYQYLAPQDLPTAIQKTASVLETGGYFIGDFITPDHIRWYPNVLRAAHGKVVSIRTPRLIEDSGRMYQESEITNLNFMGEQLHITYSGKHRRFLAPMHRVRRYFEQHFGGPVRLFDAVSQQEIPEWADSCKSTRYVVLAQKG